MAIPEKELEDRLREVGSRLGSPPTAVDELLPLLDKVESFLSRVEQSPSQSMLNALQPTMNALVAKELLGYSDTDVKVALASCISEVTRITAPDAPYDDDSMKELFLRIVESFEKLDDMSSTSYGKRVSILETVAKVRSCVVMLDLECDDLILDMFRHFLKTISLNHPENVFSSMETIMTLVIEESEDISPNLVSCLLDSVEKGNKLSSLRLAEKVICNCAVKLKPTLMERLQDVPLSKYSKIVYSLCHENSDALEHNDEDASADDMADDSKLSERTVSDELPQGSAKLQQEVGCSEEISTVKSKSSGVMMSNGTTPLGSGEFLAKTTTTKQKCKSSCQGGQSESTVLGNAEEPDNLEPAAVKLDSDLNGKKIRGRKTNCSSQLIEATDCYRVNSDEETTIVPGRKKGPKREADSAQFLGPSAKDVESSLSLDCTKRNELQPPLTADSGTRQVESLLDSARPKGGRHHGSKVSAKRGRGDMATNEVLPHSELKRVVGNNGIQDHVLPSESLDSKELQGISDSEGKSLTGLARNGQPNSASVHETPDIVTGNSELKSRGLAAKTGSTRNVSEGESSQKQKSNFKQKGKANSEENKTGEPSLKKMISPMACSKALGKIEGKSGENGGSKRKRGDGNKVSASKESIDLDESLVGSKIKVWWPDDKRFYNGMVSSFNPASKKHKILYNDGDVEVLLLSKERWEFVGGDTESDGGQAKDLPTPVVTPEMLLSGKPKACVGRPQKLAKVETPKSGEESNSVRGQDLPKCRGRPKGGGSKIVMSTEDDSSKSTSKSMEKAVDKGKLKLEKEGTANTGGKLKMDASSQSKGDTDTDGPISKDDGSKNDANSSDGVAKAGRKSRNHTLNHTSKSKDEVSSSEKNRKDTTKSLSTEHTPGIRQKSKDINTAKTGEGPKTDDLALERKLRESEASAAKKRKRKSQR
ncbi:sister chromatid cohesion protein PDS5 homolog C-like isoform X2 [Typha angustifolia]|uniref:sister chromatid cohesion protein PDS5 homolog C-like isoform X2 n=1 Tax=Typha angustifolia TaxID=59011 RepID=UPI003C2FDB70